MQPGVDALTHVAEHACGQHGSRGERDQTDDDPAFTAGGRVQHGHEHGEEHKRGAQIMLHDEHAHRGDPHHDDRAEILDTRQLQTEHLLTAHGQLVAMVELLRAAAAEAGITDIAQKQGQLVFTLAQSRNPDPNARAVHFLTDKRQHRGEQQHQAHHHRHVGEAPQHAVVLQEDDEQRGKHDGDAQPDQLTLGNRPTFALVDAGDHGHASGGQQ